MKLDAAAVEALSLVPQKANEGFLQFEIQVECIKDIIKQRICMDF
jgi:hypothetical protein